MSNLHKGGSGWTFAYGCALDVAQIVIQHFKPSKI